MSLKDDLPDNGKVMADISTPAQPDVAAPDLSEGPLPPDQPGRAVRAVRWIIAGNAVQRLITLLTTFVIVRLLSDTEFGAYRQLLSVHLVLFVVLPLGFDQLYIREVQKRRGMYLMLGGALAVTATTLAVAALVGHWLWVRLMQFEGWSWMLVLAPAIIALQAWKYIYKTDLAARLRYREISIGETLYAAISSIGGLALAMKYPVAGSLYVAYAAAEVGELFWLRAKSPVKFPPAKRSMRLLRRYGFQWIRFCTFHCGNQVLNGMGSNAPTVILGSAMSKAAAASFSMANWLVTVPVYLMVGALHRVAFTALAGKNRHQLVAPVLQMLRLAAVFIVPVLVWVAVMAEPAVHVALGAGWVEETAPAARALCMYCVFAALFSPVSSLDILLDRPDYGFWWNVVATTLRIAAVVLGLRVGLAEAILYYSMVSAVMWLIWGIMLMHLLGTGQWVAHRAWMSAAPLWLVLATMLIAVRWMAGTNPWVALALAVIPAGVYALLARQFYPAVWTNALRIMKR